MTPKRNEHLSLICNVGELANLVSDSKDVDSFLQQVVQLVAANLNADVGSIYLYDESADELVLTATIGLNPQAVGKIRMKTDEGLVGYTMAQMAPICEGCAADNPHFKYFESAQEERFCSFLSVPISLGSQGQQFHNYFRITFGLPWSSRVEEGLNTLGELAKKF